jgi:uncharacterized protein YcgL (UPF0745 family)
MDKKKKQKVVNVTVEILDFFLGIPEALVVGFDRKEFYRVVHGVSTEKSLTVSNIAKFLNNLKKEGYV